MTQAQALSIIQETLAPLKCSEDQFLMRDLGLQSLEIMQLFVDLERKVGNQIDLISLLRDRSEAETFSRDFKVLNLAQALMTVGKDG
jgi:acyl carrier protein